MSENVNETAGADSVASETGALARKIADALSEPNIALIEQIITVIGPARTNAVFLSALEVEAGGGLMTSGGDRRRTQGGVFFHLIRKAIAGKEKRQIWPPADKKPGAPQGTGDGVTNPGPKPAPILWAQVVELAKQVKEQPGEARTVKITLIGRPLKIVKQPECVILSMKGREPSALPKGLPSVPAGSAITWAVFIANKQWAKVAASISNQPEDNLIVEGYPLLKDGVAVVLAQSCKSVLLEKAAKAQKVASEATR